VGSVGQAHVLDRIRSLIIIDLGLCISNRVHVRRPGRLRRGFHPKTTVTAGRSEAGWTHNHRAPGTQPDELALSRRSYWRA
jgi:hypothetical protein